MPGGTPRSTPPALTVATAGTVLDQIDRLPYRGGGYQTPSDLPRFVSTSIDARDSIRGPVLPVALAATALALLLVAAAGFLWAEQRSGEVALLTSRGVSSGPIGFKAALEMLIPVTFGALVGWAGSIALVRWLGPSPLIEPGALSRAVQTVGLAALVGLCALGILAGLRSRRSVDVRSGRRFRWALLPWEIAFLVAAVLTYRRARAEGGAAAFAETISLNPLLIAFPLLALVGALLLIARLVAVLLPVLRRRSRRWPPALWLSIRRMASTIAVTLTVFVLAAVPVGVLIYSAGLTESLVQTVTAKAEIYSGAVHALDMEAEPGYDPDLGGHGTVVTVIRDGVANGQQIEVLGVDTDTFAQFAAWDPAAVGAEPEDLVPLISGTGTRSTAILVAWDGEDPVREVQLRSTTLTVDVVATAPAFPGLRLLKAPMIVVDRATVVDSDRYTQRQDELWTDDANLPAALLILDGEDVTVDLVRTPDAFLGVTDLLPIGWMFGYLQTIAALTGVIAVTALLLYLAVRQRQRFAAFHLSRRMGVNNASHLRSLLSEVGAVLGLAWLAGVAVALCCVRLAYPLLEVNADFPPAPLVDAPLTLLVVSAVALVAAAAGTAVAAHAAARSTQASAVLRLD
ncbi:MAG: FtsX-like permease family protein [Geodermatophilaceae bacterium]